MERNYAISKVNIKIGATVREVVREAKNFIVTKDGEILSICIRGNLSKNSKDVCGSSVKKAELLTIYTTGNELLMIRL